MQYIAFTIRHFNEYEIIIKYDRNVKITGIAISYIQSMCYECILELFDHSGAFTIDLSNKVLTHCDKKYDLHIVKEPEDFAIFRIEHTIRHLITKYPFHTNYSDKLHNIVYKYMLLDKPCGSIEIPHDYLVNYPIDNEKVIAIINKAQEDLRIATRESFCKFDYDDFCTSLKPLAPDPFPPRPRSKSLDPSALARAKSSSFSKSIPATPTTPITPIQPIQPMLAQPDEPPMQPMLAQPDEPSMQPMQPPMQHTIQLPSLQTPQTPSEPSEVSISNSSTRPLLANTSFISKQELQPLLELISVSRSPSISPHPSYNRKQTPKAISRRQSIKNQHNSESIDN